MVNNKRASSCDLYNKLIVFVDLRTLRKQLKLDPYLWKNNKKQNETSWLITNAQQLSLKETTDAN